MRKTLPILLLLALAACNRQPAEPAATPAPTTPAATAPAKPAAPVGNATLKTPLPEDFALPFEYNRLYDNAVKTKDGKQQRRVMVEFIGQDAAAVQAALTTALAAKGFSAPETTADASVYKRKDGAMVTVKIDPTPKRLRAPGAVGTLHLVWDSV